MASSYSSNPSSITMFIHLVLMSTAFFARPSTSLLLDEVCNRTKNPSLCKSILVSDPRAKTATLSLLEIIAIEIATTRTSRTKARIHSLYLNEKDARLKSIYGGCDNGYALALEGLEAASAFARAGRQDEVSNAATTVSGDADRCEKSFAGRSTLSNDNLTVELLGSVIAVIANLLG